CGLRGRARAWPSAQQGTLAAVDELKQLAHVVAGLGLHAELLAGLGQRQPGHVQGAVGALDRGDALGREATALEALAVDAARAPQRVAADHGERRHVAVDQRAHAEEGVGADAAELVGTGEAADDHPVAHGDVAGQGGVVGEHAVVADDAVVGDVAVGQQPVVVADAGDAAAAAGAAVDGDELAEHVAVADHQLGALAGELLVLRFAADRAMADEAVLAADPGGPGEAAVRADLAAVADFDLRADHGVGADADAL